MKKAVLRLLISLVFCFFASSPSVEGQGRNRTGAKSAKPTIVAGKAGVYIEFKRLGKRTPLRNDEIGDGIWLQLHNNMRYSINVCSFGISAEGEQLITYRENSQIGIMYDVLRNPVALTDERSVIDVPLGYNTGNSCHLFAVRPGKSLVFAVPAEHLVRGLSIKVPFTYAWEALTVNNPSHFVYFNSLDIPTR